LMLWKPLFIRLPEALFFLGAKSVRFTQFLSQKLSANARR